MKKRIGTKLYDTEKGILVIPEMHLYKQPKNKTFYTFDGETITPVEYDEAEKIIRETKKPELLSMLENKTDQRGSVHVAISLKHYNKLTEFCRKSGISRKKLLENYIDSLSVRND